jgi:Ca2+-binding EF-hand superfamily protein
MDIMRKFDKNKDGLISFLELVEGLREHIGIKIFKGE